MPPKFLTLNVISETARKNDSNSGNSFKKVENVYDIFEDESTSNLRRSARINNKKSCKYIENFNKDIINEKFSTNCSVGNDCFVNPHEKHEPKRQCKSLFKEINRRYAEVQDEESNKNKNFEKGSLNDLFIENLSQNTCSNSQNFFNGEIALWNVKTEKKIEPSYFDEVNNIFQNNTVSFSPEQFEKYEVQPVNSDFCIRLSKQLLDDIGGFKQEVLDECNSRIKEKIHGINYILQGNKPKSSQVKMKYQHINDNEPEILDLTFEPLSHTDWIFQTPNKQKVVKNNKRNRAFTPAFVYRNDDNKISSIIELNPDDVTIDLTKFKFQDPMHKEVPMFVKPAGFFNQVPLSFSSGQNNVFDVNRSSNVGSSLDIFSQQSCSMSQKNVFDFKSTFAGKNFFL